MAEPVSQPEPQNIIPVIIPSEIMLEIQPPNLLGNTVSNSVVAAANLMVVPPHVVAVKPATLPTVDPLFNAVKDIAFNLILQIPGLRAKLNNLLDEPNMAIQEISKVFEEIQTKIPQSEMTKLRTYISKDSSRSNLLNILMTSFQDILADGRVDMNDVNHFLNLIHNIISLFNQTSQETDMDITISGDAVMFFLYFIIKCILILCLEGPEETLAVSLLDSSFKLVSLAVLPLKGMKCKCNLFSWCK
jgi:hypothetical protein